MTSSGRFATDFHQAHDLANLEHLARCHFERLPLPGVLCVGPSRRSMTPGDYLESLLSVRRPCPAEVISFVVFADPGATVADVAEGLLLRFRRTGQLPQAAGAPPMQVRARDDADALSQLARIYRAERKPPAVVTVRAVETSTVNFLAGLSHDRSPLPFRRRVGHRPALQRLHDGGRWGVPTRQVPPVGAARMSRADILDDGPDDVDHITTCREPRPPVEVVDTPESLAAWRRHSLPHSGWRINRMNLPPIGFRIAVPCRWCANDMNESIYRLSHPLIERGLLTCDPCSIMLCTPEHATDRVAISHVVELSDEAEMLNRRAKVQASGFWTQTGDLKFSYTDPTDLTDDTHAEVWVSVDSDDDTAWMWFVRFADSTQRDGGPVGSCEEAALAILKARSEWQNA